ncbi:hypothetical protein ABPG74_020933 [Tetrahymena malaccensis]
MNQGENVNLRRDNQRQQLEIIQEFQEEFMFQTRAINVYNLSAENKEQQDEDQNIYQNEIQEQLDRIDNYQEDTFYYDTFEEQNPMLYQENFGNHQILGLVHEANVIEDQESDDEQIIQMKKSYGFQQSAEENKIKERDFYLHHKLIKRQKKQQEQNEQNSELKNNLTNSSDAFTIAVFDVNFKDQVLFQEKIQCGMIQQQHKQINNGDVIIGREQEISNQNNINLFQDSQVSKQHCKLITEYYYKKNNTQLDCLDLVLNFYENQYKKNKNSIDIITKVLTLTQIQDTLKKFLYQKPCLYLVDLSSTNGTQVQIDFQKHTRIAYDQTFQCGIVNFNVQEINDLKHYDNFLTLISDYLLEELIREQINEQQTFNKCGLPNEILNFVIESFKEISSILKIKVFYQTVQKQQFSEIYKTWILKFLQAKLKKSKNRFEVNMIPYIKLKVCTQQERPKNYFLFHDKTNPKIFKVGKSRECDVIVFNNLVSRNHCEINYNPQTCQWLIRDGSQQNSQRVPSKNKTWINLQNHSQQDYLETIPYRLEPDQVYFLKLGSTIINIKKQGEIESMDELIF